jgi:hypothetical protein
MRHDHHAAGRPGREARMSDLWGRDKPWKIHSTDYQGFTGVVTEDGLYVCNVPHNVAEQIVSDHNQQLAALASQARLVAALEAFIAYRDHDCCCEDGTDCAIEHEHSYGCDGDCDVAIEIWERAEQLGRAALTAAARSAPEGAGGVEGQ